MKNLVYYALAALSVAAAMFVSSCSKSDISALWDEIEDINARMDSLENALNYDIDAVYRLLNSAIKDGLDGIQGDLDDLEGVVDAIVSVVNVVEKDGRITVTLSDNTTIVVNSASDESFVTVVEEGGVAYWALVDASGNVTVLKDASGNRVPVSHPGLKFQLDDNSREIKYSLDGGKTWINSGIVIPSSVSSSPLITNVVDNGDYVTFYLGTFSFDVRKMVVEHFTIQSGKLYFNPGETKSVIFSIAGYKSSFVAACPKGWEAAFDGKEMTVTAPAADDEAAAAAGHVEIWVATEGAKLLVGRVNVEVADAAVAMKTSRADGIYTAEFTFLEDSEGVVAEAFYGISPLDGFDRAEMYGKIVSGEYTQTNDGAASRTVAYSEILGAQPVVGKTYVLWAYVPVYDAAGKIVSGDDDFILSFCVPSEVTLTSVPKFNEIDLNIKVNGAESFHVVTMDADFYDPENFDIQLCLNPTIGLVEGYTYASDTYEGPYSALGWDPALDMKNTVAPGGRYVVLVLPMNPYLTLTDYTNDDLWVFNVEASQLTSGGTATVTLGTPVEEITYISVPVTSTGVLTYWMYLTATELSVFNTDEKIAGYLVSNTNTKASYTDEKEFKARKSTEPSEQYTFAAVAVDAEGRYGQIQKVEVQSKEMPEPEFEVSVDILDFGSKSVQMSLSVTGGTAHKYVYMNASYDAGEYVQSEMIEAYNGSGDYRFRVIDASSLTDGTLTVDGIQIGSHYYFYVMAFEEDGSFSNLAMIEYYVELNSELFVPSTSADWTASKPEISVWGDAECTVSDLVKDGNFLDLYIKAVRNDKIANLYFAYQYESQLGGLEGKELLEYLMSINYSTTMVTPGSWDENGAYVQYYNVADDSVKRFVYWEDADGRFYEPVLVEYEYTVGSETDPDEEVDGGSTEK